MNQFQDIGLLHMIQIPLMEIYIEICHLLIKEITILIGTLYILVIIEKNQKHISTLSIQDQEMLYNRNGLQFNIDSLNLDLLLQ